MPSPHLITDRYDPVVQLGESPSATTFLAEDRAESRRVVVRFPSDELLKEPSFAHLFEREALELLRVRHPHIVRVLDVGRHDGAPFLVTEYVEGDSLAHRLAPAPSPQTPTQVYAWLIDCAEALDFIHAKKATHRNVGTTSILFASAEDARLTDFVFASTLDALRRPVSIPYGNALRPHLLAPELRQGGAPSPRSDLYALAATVYQAITGNLLDADLGGAEAALRSHVSPEAGSDVLRALSPDPALRFPSCYEFARAFGLERRRPPRKPLPFHSGPTILTGRGGLTETLPQEQGFPHASAPPAARFRVPTPLPSPGPPALPASDRSGEHSDPARAPLPNDGSEATATAGQRTPSGIRWEEGSRIWRVAMGAAHSSAQRAIEAGFVSPGWDELDDLRSLAEAHDPRVALRDLLGIYARAYGVSGLRARLGAAQVWRFVRAMSSGDFVLVPSPSGETVHVGRLRGAYTYAPGAADGLGQPHRRKTEWILEQPRADLPPALRDGLDGPQAIQCLDGFWEPVRALIDGTPAGSDPTTPPASVLEAVVSALLAAGTEAFEDVLAAWAAADGLDVEILPGPVEEQWEAVGMLSAATPIVAPIRLWIHRTRAPLDEHHVLEARGALGADEMGTLVALAGFTGAARAEAASSGKKSVRLVDGTTLADRLIRRWEHLPIRVQSRLGVARLQKAVVTTRFEALPGAHAAGGTSQRGT